MKSIREARRTVFKGTYRIMVSTGEKKMRAFEERKEKKKIKLAEDELRKNKSVFYCSELLPLESSILGKEI